MATLQTVLTGAAVVTSGSPVKGALNVYNAASGNISVTLPALSGLTVGARLAVKKSDSSAYTVTFTPAGSDAFQDGSASAVLQMPGQQMELMVIKVGSTVYWAQGSTRKPLASLDARYESLANKNAANGYAGLNSSSQLTNDTTGNAATATKWATARTFTTSAGNTVSVDGSSNVTFVDTSPITATVLAFQTPKGSNSASTVAVAANIPYRVQSSPAVDDWVEWDVLLRSGTYAFDLYHFKTANIGIYTVTLDGGSSLGTIDGYNSPNLYAVNSITGIAVSTTGIHTIRLQMKTKNASAGNYYYAPIQFTMTRTGA